MKEKLVGVGTGIIKEIYINNTHVSRKRKKYQIIKLFFSIFLFMVCFHCQNAFAAIKSEKHVLIINPFTQDYPGSQLYIKGIKSELEKKSEFKFTYSYEYGDLARHSNDEGYLEDIAKYLKSKYLKNQPDFIITAVTLNSFFSKYGDNIFPNVPVIIDWDKESLPVNAIPTNHIIISQLSAVDENIQLILKTQPLTKKFTW